MAEQRVYTVIDGTLKLSGVGGSIVINVRGERPPQTLDELPDYIGDCARRALMGFSGAEIEKLRKENMELKRMVDDLKATTPEEVVKAKSVARETRTTLRRKY